MPRPETIPDLSEADMIDRVGQAREDLREGRVLTCRNEQELRELLGTQRSCP
ncbi:MAG: hypothetical protein ACRDY0_08970 [Acidimicrobiales bacterium]